ncbi:MAG: hypothetical protein IJP74_13400 [Prevotella sp.]|nr:hypothetical protein [Prevotella sp.]
MQKPIERERSQTDMSLSDGECQRSATGGVANSPFSKIQFIGVAISTTPSGLTSIEETSDDGKYAGFVDEGTDIRARIKFISDVLDNITSSEKFDGAETTLKVIVFPEFLMRGTKGAYLRDNFLPYIQQILQLSNRKDVLLFIGSVLTAELPPSYDSDFYFTGDKLLDVYYRLHKDTNARQRLHDILSRADGKDSTVALGADDAFDDILVKVLNYSDSQAKQIIENRCYVVAPSFSTTILKQYKSKEDFVLNSSERAVSSDHIRVPLYLQTTTKYAEINESANSNESVFSYYGISFGVEICLDHKRQRLKNAVIPPVDVQIIPSCGMNIRPEAVVARNGGFVFNCDGEYELGATAEVKGVNGKNSHTSLCSVDNDELSEAYNVDDDLQITDTNLKDLFRNDTFNIHIYKSIEIKL